MSDVRIAATLHDGVVQQLAARFPSPWQGNEHSARSTRPGRPRKTASDRAGETIRSSNRWHCRSLLVDNLPGQNLRSAGASRCPGRVRPPPSGNLQ